MEQRFKEYKEFYKKHGGELLWEIDDKADPNQPYNNVRYEQIGVKITDDVTISTDFCYTSLDGVSFVPDRMHHNLWLCDYAELKIDSTTDLLDLINTFKKYLK